MSGHLVELDYEPDNSSKSWHMYNSKGELECTVTIDYSKDYRCEELEQLVALYCQGYRLKD